MDSQYFDTLRRIAQPIRASKLPHTLDPMHHLLDALGNPQQHFRSIVVTGSTGKGTTCVRLADLLSMTRLKVGLYTSPHLHSFRERIVIVEAWQGDPMQRELPRRISQGDFVAAAQQVFAAQQTLDHAYSTFETTTALAFVWFAQQHIDVAVLEVGIGGRFDAVNTVANSLAVFTPIEAEHVAMLGGSLESVAWHKAGIIQPDGIAVSVPQSSEVQAILEREATEKNAALHFSPNPLTLIPDLLSKSFPLITHYSSLITSPLPARLEYAAFASHAVIIDGGHTPAAARYMLGGILYTDSIRFIVGMFRDKNVAAYLSTFDLPQFHFVYTQAPGDRALTPDELLARYTPTQAAVTLVPTPDEAFAQIETAPEQVIIVAGSFRMAAAAREAFGLLTPEDLDESRRTRAIFEGDDYQRKLT